MLAGPGGASVSCFLMVGSFQRQHTRRAVAYWGFRGVRSLVYVSIPPCAGRMQLSCLLSRTGHGQVMDRSRTDRLGFPSENT